jgi:signal peptidase I
MPDFIEKDTEVEEDSVNKKSQPKIIMLNFLKFIFELFKLVLIVIVLAAAIRYFLISPYQVDGSSMTPTLTDKDYLLVEKVNFIFRNPSRGDIVVFRYPLNTTINYVKRIIGVAGDKITIKDGNITVSNSQYPSGVVLQENYLSTSSKTSVMGDSSEKSWVVSEGEFFVLGDNREHSDDSRSWGIVPKENILGKVWLEVYPREHFGIVEHATY